MSKPIKLPLNFVLRGLVLQEEWRCAWEACLDFLREHPNHFGRRHWVRYHFDSPEGEITIAVWRSQRGIEAERVHQKNNNDEHLEVKGA